MLLLALHFDALKQVIYNFKLLIALSTQLVRFLRGTPLSEVVFASKSSFYPAIHWDLSERKRIFHALRAHGSSPYSQTTVLFKANNSFFILFVHECIPSCNDETSVA